MLPGNLTSKLIHSIKTGAYDASSSYLHETYLINFAAVG